VAFTDADTVAIAYNPRRPGPTPNARPSNGRASAVLAIAEPPGIWSLVPVGRHWSCREHLPPGTAPGRVNPLARWQARLTTTHWPRPLGRLVRKLPSQFFSLRIGSRAETAPI
jgi:hypothetical protein